MTFIIIGILVILVLWGVSVQNKLVKLDEFCANALKQINVQQQSRYDALKSLIKLTREYAEFESSTLEKVIASRSFANASKPDVNAINDNQNLLNEVSSKLFALAEAYPDLKSNQQYMKTMEDLTRYEDNVRLSRMTFNDTVTKFNSTVRMFPASLIASMLHFEVKDYLKEDTSKTEYPEI